MVESFLVIDTRRISFNSYVTIHSEVALFLMSECLILFIKVLPFSIARVSPPWSALIFSNSAGPHQGLSCEPCNVLRQELLLSLSFLFSSSQALISQRSSSTSSYRVRHHSFASPERYIVAIVTWSSKGARTGDLSPQKAPQFDLVRHVLDIATGIVEAP